MTFILAIIGIILVGVEVVTASTFFIWIAIGFLCASLTSIVTSNIIIIAFVGIITAVGSIVGLKDKYIKYIQPKDTPTTYNELIGKFAIMQADYTSNGVDVGLARVGGVDWTVQCATSHVSFKAGERVVIRKIEGVRLIIEREE